MNSTPSSAAENSETSLNSPPQPPRLLTLILSNFCQWEQCTITLPLQGVTLLSGDSGAGKTTIFHAIAWCLYGGRYPVSPQHLDSEKVKTIVTIQLPLSLRGNTGILAIERQRNSARLRLCHTSINTIYEDDVAQELINELFGTSLVWNSASYLTQKEYNQFLTSSNSEKMDLLNSLAFRQDNPELYLEKVDLAIDVAMRNYQTALLEYQTLHSYHQQQVYLYPQAQRLTDPQVVQIQTLQLDYQTQSQELQQQQVIRTQQLQRQQDYQRELASLVEPIPPSGPAQLIADLAQYHCTINDGADKLTKWIFILQQRDVLNQQLNVIRSDVSSNNGNTTIYHESDYQAALATEQAYHNQARTCQTFQLQYQEQVIREHITKITGLLQQQPALLLYKEQQQLRCRLTQVQQTFPNVEPLPPTYPSIVARDITVPAPPDSAPLQATIKDLTQQRSTVLDKIRLAETILTCPQCEVPLSFHQHKLVLNHSMDTVKIDQLREELKLLDQQLTTVQQQQQQQQQQYHAAQQQYQKEVREQQLLHQQVMQERSRLEQQYQQQLIKYQHDRRELQQLMERDQYLTDELAKQPTLTSDQLNATPLPGDTCAQYQHQLNQLKTVVFLSLPPVSSEEIRRCMLVQQQQLRRIQLEDELNTLISTLPVELRESTTVSVKDCHVRLQQYHASIEGYHKECQRVQAKRELLMQQLDQLVIPDDSSEKLELYKGYLLQYQQLLLHHQEGLRLEELQGQVIQKYQTVTNTHQAMSEHQQLRDLIMETYCHALDDVTASINEQVQEYCMNLFDDPITITLNLYKIQKSSKLLKPNVNFTVAYKGGVFDGIKRLSGGEKDRVSLAVTLALSQLSHCPFILLDESLTALDNNRRDMVVEMLRTQGTAVWLIMHDAVEGMFNTVLPVTNLGVKSLQK